MRKQTGSQDECMSVSTSRVERTLRGRRPLPHAVSVPTPSGEGEESLSRISGNSSLKLSATYTCSKNRVGVKAETLWTWEVTVEETGRASYWRSLT